ncbi:MAG: RNA-binding protein [Bacteroidia bacterium]|nr:RNA-binding protein [Bacteroidia bacterium]
MIRLRVTSIAPSLTKDKLVELFEEIGDVDSIKVFRTLDNASVAMALIEMKRDREGEAAVAALNGQMINGTKLKVEFSQDMVKSSGVKHKPVVVEDEDEDEDEDGEGGSWKSPAIVKPNDPDLEDELEDEGLGMDEEEDDEEESFDDDEDEDDDDDPKEISLDDLDEEI